MAKKIPRVYLLTSREKNEAVLHLVYEYANLVCAGVHLQTAPGNPLDTLVQDAFLLNCRKMAEFFGPPTGKDDVKAAHYLLVPSMPPGFSLPTWHTWKGPMDKQLAHLTYSRVTSPQSWTGGANVPLLREFRAAFDLFLRNIDPAYRPLFEKELAERRKSLKLTLP